MSNAVLYDFLVLMASKYHCVRVLEALCGKLVTSVVWTTDSLADPNQAGRSGDTLIRKAAILGPIVSSNVYCRADSRLLFSNVISGEINVDIPRDIPFIVRAYSFIVIALVILLDKRQQHRHLIGHLFH
jgi:hypothetical protein